MALACCSVLLVLLVSFCLVPGYRLTVTGIYALLLVAKVGLRISWGLLGCSMVLVVLWWACLLLVVLVVLFCLVVFLLFVGLSGILVLVWLGLAPAASRLFQASTTFNNLSF